MANKKIKKNNSKRQDVRVKFDYLKANHFRDIHVDGVFGGLSPRGYIDMAVYSERYSIPQQTVNPINQNGSLGKEIKEDRVSRNSVIRELEANLKMDLQSAKNIVTWLKEQIETLEKLNKRKHRRNGK